MKQAFLCGWVWALLAAAAGAAEGRYAIVVSQQTWDKSDWKPIVQALQAKYPAAQLIQYDGDVSQSLAALKQYFPQRACFVARPDEATRQFVAQVHCLTRQLDDDPYTDCLWGILTGYDAANALAIAKETRPLVIHKAAAGTEIALDKLEAGLWYCELNQNKLVQKAAGGAAQEIKGPDDTTAALADSLTKYRPDLFVTSGHATERDWQIGFRYRNGQFRSQGGALFGFDTQQHKLPIQSDNPKVYLAVGNCLMGHIDGPDAMALAWLKSAGVRQMVGYTVLTWYGYAGWGMLDYFVEQPGRYSLAEAFYVNEQALLHRIETNFPQASGVELNANGRPVKPLSMNPTTKDSGLTPMDAAGLLYDRDVVAFYGDPGWEARVAPGALSYEQSLTSVEGVYRFVITPKAGKHSFEPVNTNGSQRGWRPIIAFLPERLTDIKVISGSALQPVITDNFILVPNPRVCDPEKNYEVIFSARTME